MKFFLFVFLFVSIIPYLQAEIYYSEKVILEQNNYKIVEVIIGGKPEVEMQQPALDREALRQNRDIYLLDEVPAFTWSYGSANTVGAMMMGYYDRLNYVDMYNGPANNGVCPLTNEDFWGEGECPLSATHQGIDGLTSRGHVDDYYISQGNDDEDPFMTGGWEEHVWADCVGDFMGTSQYNWNCVDGETQFMLIDAEPIAETEMLLPLSERFGSDISLFVESRGYSVSSLLAQVIEEDDDLDYILNDFHQDIIHGRPVLLLLNGMCVTGVGYDSSNQDIYFHDTRDGELHSMGWFDTYDGMHLIGAVSIALEPYGITAGFSANILSGIPPLQVHFNNFTEGDNVSYEWDFDCDGIIDSEEEEPEWTYETAGLYSVSLHAFNEEFSDILTITDYINVNTPPVLALPQSFSLESGSTLEINLSQYAYDVDGDDITLSVSGMFNLNVELSGLILTVQAPENFYGQEVLLFELTDGQETVNSFCTFIVFQGVSYIYVPDDYQSIQSAIDASVHGSRIIVSPGTYHENLLLGDNMITLNSLYGETGDEAYISETIIDGANGNVITVTDGVAGQELSGFRITGSYQGSGLESGNRSFYAHHLIFDYNMNARGSAIKIQNGSPRLEYITFYNNFASGSGGTVYCQNSHPLMRNLTFYGNHGNSGTAILAEDDSAVEVMNCIIYGNEVPVLNTDISSTIDISYSDIQIPVNGEGNFSIDPLFLDPGSYNLHLQNNSPCIDTGNPDTDGDGISWIEDVDDQDSDGTRKDIGAWYYNQNYSADEQVIPAVISLDAYPNPFITGSRAQLKISYSLETTNSDATLDIYNIKGQLVRNYLLPSGKTGSLSWDGNNVSSGLYLLKLHNGMESVSRKVLLLK
ncbi:MAG: T9SS type A sorting domain-containing protein [Candidatus Cloacimonetes bacterium]|nr:T9SS type A sorting domain-containing protein [Candidatus Cloacimonadota bacterium]